MNKEQEKVLKESIGKLIDNNLENDINTGETLLNACIIYDNLSKLNYVNNCNKKHKTLVLNYIQDIINRYSIILGIFNIINGYIGTGNSEIECSSIGNYVEFLKRLKSAKKYKDNVEKVIKIFKGEDINE